LKLLTNSWTNLEFLSVKSELVELNFIINETLQSFILLHVLNLEVIGVLDVATIVVDPFNVEFDTLFSDFVVVVLIVVLIFDTVVDKVTVVVLQIGAKI
jgi:hypothetical protein